MSAGLGFFLKMLTSDSANPMMAPGMRSTGTNHPIAAPTSSTAKVETILTMVSW